VTAASNPGFVQNLDRNLFQHAGANAAEHVFPAAAFQDKVVDAGAAEEPGKKQSRWSCSDDCDLRPHFKARRSTTRRSRRNHHGRLAAFIAGIEMAARR
jgi:hypothetical protein